MSQSHAKHQTSCQYKETTLASQGHTNVYDFRNSCFSAIIYCSIILTLVKYVSIMDIGMSRPISQTFVYQLILIYNAMDQFYEDIMEIYQTYYLHTDMFSFCKLPQHGV